MIFCLLLSEFGITVSSGFSMPDATLQRETMPSNPGQNLHLVSPQIHSVVSSSHLANLSSQLVILSSYLVESSSHLVVSSILLTSPLLVYSSVILQLVVSPFNSSCRTSTRRSLYPYILAHRLDTLVKSTFFKSYSVIRLWIVLLDTPKICPIFTKEN